MPVMATDALEAERKKLIQEVNRTGDAYDSVVWTGRGSRLFAKRAYKKAKKAMKDFYALHKVSKPNRK